MTLKPLPMMASTYQYASKKDIFMSTLRDIQNFQLKLIESASVNESCAADLLSILRKLTATEASSVLGIISLLQSEAEILRKLSGKLASQTLCEGSFISSVI